MKKHLAVAALVFALGGAQWAVAQTNGNGVGNPWPGVPHDTIVIHVQKPPNSGQAKGCAVEGGGHALFLRYDPVTGVVSPHTHIFVTMIDWIRVDNDGDGFFDEDPDDNINNDPPVFDENGDQISGDDLVDEDGPEPGKETYAIDCDSWDDDEVRLQIRDTEPEKGVISLQKWFLRLIGKPQEEFHFTTFASQVVSCEFVLDGDGNQIIDPITDDPVVECTYNTEGDWVELKSFNLSQEDGSSCVKQVKLGGGGVKQGGRTPFCDITDGFLVDVDTDGVEETVELPAQFVFSISCVDPDPLLENPEDYCPLSNLIWEIDEATGKAKVQVFVSHYDAIGIKKGRIVP